MTDTTHIKLALSTHQIKAMRNANDISFHVFDGRCFIDATKRGDLNDGYGMRDLAKIEIDAEPAWTLYSRDGGQEHKLRPVEAFFSIGSAQFSPEWLTAAKFLKVGDELVLRWTTNPSNLVRDAGVRLIEFRLEVRRTTGKKREHLVFLLGTVAEKPSSDFYIKYA